MLSELLASLRARLLTSSSLTQETVRDGQTLTNGFFQSVVVDNTPAFILNNDMARFLNFGQVETNDAPSAVSVEADDVDVFNFRTGSIEANGAAATGIEVIDGASADIRNFGSIAGDLNGVEFTGAGSSGSLINFRNGVVSSDSRAVEIEGDGISVRNFGDIVGTGDQRNGTIYTNATAENVSISNFAGGTIDAGEDNSGAGISLQVGDEADDVVSNTIFNGFGATIQGRGQEAANTGGAGDGIRIDDGAEGAVSDTDIVNSGLISSESNQGTAGGIRIADGVSAEGRILNTSTGTIEGVRNGLYIGEGEHDLDVQNFGTIQSGSRAVNIDGTGVDLLNGGDILGTSDQRNGTVYADGTADNYTFTNTGLVDAGIGNNGSAVSLQTGDENGDVVSAAVFNEGTLQGRGDAEEGNTVGDGLRLFSNQEDASFAGLVQNEGIIAGSEDSDAAAGIRIDGGLNLLGAIINEGEISGSVNAIDATDAGQVTFVNDDEGVVNGNVLLGDGDDIVVDLGQINGVVDGGAGDDVLIAGDGDNVLVGGLGNDFIEGGDGVDTADFSDLDVAVTVALDANGNGTATRKTGFSVSVQDVVVGASLQPTPNIDGAAGFVDEALAGNLYHNIHKADFPGGEIRGQLFVVSDTGQGHNRVIELAGSLDATQEPGPTSDSEATGEATLTITFNELGETLYSSELSVTGLNEADLQTPVAGVVSAIHLHNAPAGINGPIAQDTLVDAGAVVHGTARLGVSGADVIDEVVETDILSSIERVVGSDDIDTIDLSGFNGVTIDLDVNTPQPGPASQDGVIRVDGEVVVEVDDFENVLGSNGDDLILGNNEINVLEGLGGNDSIHSFGGADTIDGGEGIDTALFSAGAGVIVDLNEDGNAIAQINAPEGALIDTVLNFENINGSNNAGSPNGGNDILSGNSGANQLNGQAGDDVLNGEGGDDILIGGAGSDTFTFEGAFGNDVVRDFEVGIDQLDFTDFGPDFGDDLIVAQDGDDAVLSFGNDSSVRLEGVQSADLTDDDFVN